MSQAHSEPPRSTMQQVADRAVRIAQFALDAHAEGHVDRELGHTLMLDLLGHSLALYDRPTSVLAPFSREDLPRPANDVIGGAA